RFFHSGRSRLSNGELVMQIFPTRASSRQRVMCLSGSCLANQRRRGGRSRFFTSSPSRLSVVRTPRQASEIGECRANNTSQIKSARCVLGSNQNLSGGNSRYRNASATR